MAIIDPNPRKGRKVKFCETTEQRFKVRTVAERSNARLKDEISGRSIWAKGAAKVYSHLLFGILALSIDQVIRLKI